jgi:regulation of enolase protein 1 (concanavalin A-like superfamily)
MTEEESVFDEMQWLNEPPRWTLDDVALVAVSGDKTDFWRETFYGFVHDNGHFYYREVAGDFTAEVTVVGEYGALYDQSGLMLRADERHWVKFGLELTDGVVHASTVITREYSDWSMLALPSYGGTLRLQLTRHGDAIRAQFREPDGPWRLLRLGYLPLPETCQVGVMCCSPEQAGFEARFEDFAITEPISRDLHD